MATPQGPLPPASIPWIDKPGTPSLVFRQYFLTLDAVTKGLAGFFGAATFAKLTPPTAPGTLIAVAAPTNANAAIAGVAVGQLYTDTADPAKVYIRTV
jgi:hypothetical protein